MFTKFLTPLSLLTKAAATVVQFVVFKFLTLLLLALNYHFYVCAAYLAYVISVATGFYQLPSFLHYFADPFGILHQIPDIFSYIWRSPNTLPGDHDFNFDEQVTSLAYVYGSSQLVFNHFLLFAPLIGVAYNYIFQMWSFAFLHVSMNPPLRSKFQFIYHWTRVIIVNHWTMLNLGIEALFMRPFWLAVRYLPFFYAHDPFNTSLAHAIAVQNTKWYFAKSSFQRHFNLLATNIQNSLTKVALRTFLHSVRFKIAKLFINPPPILHAFESLIRTKLSDIQRLAFMLTTTVFDLCNALRSDYTPSRVLSLAHLAINSIHTYLNPHLIEVMWDTLKKVFGSMTPVSSDDYSHLTNIISIMLTVPLLFSGQQVSRLSFIKAFKRARTDISVSSDIADTMLDSMRWITNKGKFFLLGIDCEDPISSISQWYNDTSILIAENYDIKQKIGEVDDSLSYLMDLNSRISTYLDFVTDILNINTDHSRTSKITSNRDKLRSIHTEVKVMLHTIVMRRAPWGVMVHGSPGRGKTFVVKEITNTIGNILSHDLNKIFSFSSVDQYMTNYRSDMWAIILDDIAAVKTSTGQQDHQLLNVINLINNTPYFSVQAGVDDKGAHPVLSDIVIGTTNVKDLRASQTFNEPYAIHRRFPLFIGVDIKSEYLTENGTINSDKLAGNENDGFIFELSTPRNVARTENAKVTSKSVDNGKWEIIRNEDGSPTFTFTELLVKVRDLFTKHHQQQVKLVQDALSKPKFCTTCKIRDHFCSCEEPVYKTIDETTKVDPEILAAVPDSGVLSSVDFDAISESIWGNRVPIALAVAGTTIQAINWYNSTYNSHPQVQHNTVSMPPNSWEVKSSLDFTNSSLTTGKKIFNDLVNSNYYQILVFDSSQKLINSCHCLRMTGQSFLTVSHVFDDGYYFRVRDPRALNPETDNGLSGLCLVESSVITKHSEDDLILFRCLSFPTQGKGGLIKHLPKSGVYSGHVLAYKMAFDGPYNTNLTKGVHKCGDIKKGLVGDSMTRYQIMPGFTVPKGACGSPIIVSTDKANVIYGIICSVMLEYNSTQFVPIDAEWVRLSLTMEPRCSDGKYFEPDDKKKFHSFSSMSYNMGIHRPQYSISHKRNFQHHCKESHFYDELQKHGLPVDTWCPPDVRAKISDGVFDPVNSATPYTISRLKGDKCMIPQKRLDLAVNDLVIDLLRSISFMDDEDSFMGEVSWHEAINGYKSIKSLDFDTSSGFPHGGPKCNRLVRLPGEKREYKLTDEDQVVAEKMLNDMKAGLRVCPVYKADWKNQVIKTTSNKKGKIRAFLGSNYIYTIVCRKLTMAFQHVYKSLGLSAQHAYGFNSRSLQWDQIAHYLGMDDKQEPSIMCGDYSNFDKGMGASLMFAAFQVIFRLIGKESWQLPMAYDYIYSLVCFNGDIALMQPGNPSGSFLTTHLNIIVNTILFRVGFNEICPNDDYNQNVKLVVYGDDSIAKSNLSKFNQRSFSLIMFKYGMKYTDSNKSETTRPFTPVNECDFLNRKFVRSPPQCDQRFIAPLDPMSLLRSIAWRSPETKIDRDLWATDVLRNLRDELALYHVVDSNNNLVLELTSFYNRHKSEFSLPDFRTNKALYSFVYNGCDIDPVSYKIFPNCMPVCCPVSVNPSIEVINESKLPNNENVEVGENIDISTVYELYEQFFDEDIDLEQSLIHFLQDYAEEYPESVTEVGEKTPVSGFPGNMDQLQSQGLVNFEDNQEVLTSDQPLPPLSKRLQNKVEADLGDFLTRPVLIAHEVWADGFTFVKKFDLWNLFLTNTLVAEKIARFHAISGTMRYRIMTNGAPTKCGSMAIGVAPYKDPWFNMPSTFADDEKSKFQVSQLPGPNFDIDVSSNPVVEGRIPSVNAQEYIEVSDPTKATTPSNTLMMISYGELQDSGGGSSDVDVSIYVWLEPDYQLVVPSPVSRTKEEGIEDVKTTIIDGAIKVKDDLVAKMTDEALETNGPISSITSAFANATGALTEVPGIGSYMKLASTGLNYGSKALAFFGFSKPPMLDPPGFVKREPFGSLANTSGHDVTNTLSFDPLAGISMEPEYMGLPSHDSLAIQNIARRFSYLATFDWTAARVTGDVIAEMGVTPTYNVTGGVALGDPFVMTPLCIASYPFTYWTGSIEIMIMCITSKLTSGRLTVSFDPNGTQHAAIPSNEQYNTVIDLEAGVGLTKTCINIPWSQARKYQLISHTPNQTYTSPTGIIYNSDTMNGSIRLTVRNAVKASTDPFCRVVIFVRGGPDMDFAVPNDQIGTLTPVSRVEPLGYDDIEVINLGPPPNMEICKEQNMNYFGEKVVSFRALMKRYTIWGTFTDIGDSDYNEIRLLLPHRPGPGHDDGVAAPPLGQKAYGKLDAWGTATVLQAYLRSCYLGEKGGQRWKVALSSTVGQRVPTMLHRRSNYTGVGQFNGFALKQDPLTVESRGTSFIPGQPIDSNWIGYHSTDAKVAPVINVTVPYYNRLKFSSSNTANYLPQSTLIDGDDTFRMYSEVVSRIELSEQQWYEVHTAVADDYDLVMFLCSPMYFSLATLL